MSVSIWKIYTKDGLVGRITRPYGSLLKPVTIHNTDDEILGTAENVRMGMEYFVDLYGEIYVTSSWLHHRDWVVISKRDHQYISVNKLPLKLKLLDLISS